MCTHLDKTGSTYYFRRPVPKDLIGCFATASGKPRTEWKFSLRIKDREQAKRLLRPHVAETDTLIDEARQALRGALPEEQQASVREREEQEACAAAEAEKAARYAARSEYRVARRQRMHLSTIELGPEEAAWRDLVREKEQDLEVILAAVEGQKEANAALAGRMGNPLPSTPAQPALSIAALFERYAASGAANPKTVTRWRGRVANLVEHLGHDDASRVTRADLNGWTASLIAKGLAKKTVVDGYLPAARVAFAVAHDDGAISTNPASGLKVRAPKAAKLRDRDLTDEEALTILRATLAPPPEKLAERHALARRWVPWLCAYTGARVGEMTQLRAMDIRREAGVWVVHITPEAGSVKTNEARSVPLHPHLIEQGILALAKEGDSSPLFYEKGVGNQVNPASKIRAADLAKWVHSLGIEAPQPNHGWRHRWKTVARSASISDYVADRIQGHAPTNAGGKYGKVPLSVLRDAVKRLPQYELEGSA